MSETQSALPGARFEGSILIQEAGLRGMITLRGDLDALKLKTTVKKLTGIDIPTTGNISLKGDSGAAWMSPDELLILTPYEKAETTVTALSLALKSSHHLAVNVSDARSVFTLTGKHAREVLAKLTPADMSPTGFSNGQIRRTRLAQVPAAFWVSGTDTIDVVCFRSLADYAFKLLKQAAHPKGSPGYF